MPGRGHRQAGADELGRLLVPGPGLRGRTGNGAVTRRPTSGGGALERAEGPDGSETSPPAAGQEAPRGARRHSQEPWSHRLRLNGSQSCAPWTPPESHRAHPEPRVRETLQCWCLAALREAVQALSPGCGHASTPSGSRSARRPGAAWVPCRAAPRSRRTDSSTHDPAPAVQSSARGGEVRDRLPDGCCVQPGEPHASTRVGGHVTLADQRGTGRRVSRAGAVVRQHSSRVGARCCRRRRPSPRPSGRRWRVDADINMWADRQEGVRATAELPNSAARDVVIVIYP